MSTETTDDPVSQGTMLFMVRAAQVVLLPICFFISVQVWELTEEVSALDARVEALEKRQRALMDQMRLPSGDPSAGSDVTAMLRELSRQQSRIGRSIEQLRRRMDAYPFPPPDSLSSGGDATSALAPSPLRVLTASASAPPQ